MILKYLNDPKNFLVIHGAAGTGKTYFCACLVEWALSKFNSFRYYKESDILERLRKCIHNGNGDFTTELKMLTDDELVMWDDVGSSDPEDNEWRQQMFFNFLDERYNSMLPTIITTNFSKKDFYEIYHERVGDRLFARENTIIDLSDLTSKRKQGF